jgi:hypothetical protein
VIDLGALWQRLLASTGTDQAEVESIQAGLLQMAGVPRAEHCPCGHTVGDLRCLNGRIYGPCDYCDGPCMDTYGRCQSADGCCDEEDE